MACLRGLNARNPRGGDPDCNALLTKIRESPGGSPGSGHRWNPALSRLAHSGTATKNRGSVTVKSLVALTAIAVFTVATGVAGKPSASATDKAIADARAAKKPVMMAAQQLPFDRERSKN
jgi:hypothetical protein